MTIMMNRCFIYIYILLLLYLYTYRLLEKAQLDLLGDENIKLRSRNHRFDALSTSWRDLLKRGNEESKLKEMQTQIEYYASQLQQSDESLHMTKTAYSASLQVYIDIYRYTYHILPHMYIYTVLL